jgi:hypothetical protein
MIKLICKLTLLTLFMCCTSFIAKAQLGYNYSQYDIGTSVGFNQVFGDAKPQKTTASINFNFTFNATPYTNFVLEAQLGRLEGGDSLKTATGRQFTNDFSAYIFRGQLQFGEFLDYDHSPFLNAVKNLYVSAGVGYVVSNIKQINRNSILVPGTFTGGLDKSNVPFLPLRFGYEFKLFNKYEQPSFKVDIGYDINFIAGDNLDGFDTGMHKDIYTQFSIGVKFAIGSALTSYRKQIPY